MIRRLPGPTTPVNVLEHREVGARVCQGQSLCSTGCPTHSLSPIAFTDIFQIIEGSQLVLLKEVPRIEPTMPLGIWCDQQSPREALNFEHFFYITKVASWSHACLQPYGLPGHFTTSGSEPWRGAGSCSPVVRKPPHLLQALEGPWGLPQCWLRQGPLTQAGPLPHRIREFLRELGPGQVPWMKAWAYLNHHAAPDVVPPDGDPPVSVILLWVFDGLPILAAACFSIS